MSTRAFDIIYKEYSPAVYRVALVKTGNSELAQDVCSQTFLLLCEKKPSFDSTGQLKVWLVRTAIRIASAMLKKADESRTVSLEEHHAPVITDSLEFEFYDVLTKLDKNLREPVVMYYIEDMSVSEIAKALSIGRSAVKMRLHRARALLEKIYKEEIL